MIDMKRLLWIVQPFSVITGALALVKLWVFFTDTGLNGLLEQMIREYTKILNECQKYLVEIPFGYLPPLWAKHVFVVYALFFGSTIRLLKSENMGRRIIEGLGDRGRGRRRGTVSNTYLDIFVLLCALSGPLFLIFAFLMFITNYNGPSGTGRWGDLFMIGNRLYTRKIFGRYLIVLLLQPIVACILLVWNSIP
jgi:hypothetical protein